MSRVRVGISVRRSCRRLADRQTLEAGVGSRLDDFYVSETFATDMYSGAEAYGLAAARR